MRARLGCRGTVRPVRLAPVLAVAAVMLVGCASFDDSAMRPFTPVPTGGAAPSHPQPPPTTPPGPRPKGPCIDQDTNVVATCLDTTGGLVTLGTNSGLVAERRTGRIMYVETGRKPVEVTGIPVDSSGDGGLLGLAVSSGYAEDGLIYAYITTPSDNRVVRIAKGDVPKNILTGIPKGPSGNNGALAFTSNNQLLVLTGDAGNPAAAGNPASLAGKLLRIDDPEPGVATRPAVLLSGIGTAGGVCPDGTGNIWVTDRTPIQDRLQRIAANGTVVSPVWTWPDHPGVAGCAAATNAVAISLTSAKAMAMATVDQKTFAVTQAPTLVAQNRYGMLNAATLGPDGTVWAATVNKSPGGSPGPNDDRVVKIPLPAGGGGRD